MKQTLSDYDRTRLNTLVADVEKRKNTQVVLAVIQRSDSYAELPWKAFAMGASVTGLVVFFPALLNDGWYPETTALIAVAGVLAGGAILALLTVLLPGFARLFLSTFRSDVEVRQYAESLFLSRELFATSKRTGILVLVSLFERKVVLLPDRGLDDQLTTETMQNIIAAMTGYLKQNKVRQAFEAGLEKLSQTLLTDIMGPGKNELSDDIIEEKGV